MFRHREVAEEVGVVEEIEEVAGEPPTVVEEGDAPSRILVPTVTTITCQKMPVPTPRACPKRKYMHRLPSD